MSFEASTPNLELPQWVHTDKPQMVDFNTAFLNIDSHVIESGSNDNGNWIKFCDGTMICYRHQDMAIPIEIDQNGFKRSDWIDLGMFPVSFVSVSYISADCTIPWGDDYFAFLSGIRGSSVSSAGKVAVFCTKTAGGLCGLRYIAVGRWKSGQLYDNTGAAVLDGASSVITMANNQDYTSAYTGAQMDNLAEQGG